MMLWRYSSSGNPSGPSQALIEVKIKVDGFSFRSVAACSAS